jgi:hypothetical protein
MEDEDGMRDRSGQGVEVDRREAVRISSRAFSGGGGKVESDQHVECSCRELCLSYEPTHPSFTNNPLHLLK